MSVFELCKALPKTNGWSVLIGAIGIAVLLALKRLSKKIKFAIPGALVVVGLGTLISWGFDLEHKAGVRVVGPVPSGFPSPANPFSLVPDFWDATTHLMISAFVITVVTFISSMAISTRYADQFHYPVNGNQEFKAIGFANLFGSMFSSYPLAASLSRTAVNVQSGGNTPLAGMLSTLLVIVALLFLAPVVYFIPRPLLAAIVIVAVADIVEYRQAIVLWGTHRRDFALQLLTFVATLGIGIVQVFGSNEAFIVVWVSYCHRGSVIVFWVEIVAVVVAIGYS